MGWNPFESNNVFVKATVGDAGLGYVTDYLTNADARKAGHTASNIAMDSAAKAQKELEDAYNQLKELYAPLEASGARGLATLNQKGFTPSQTYLETTAAGGRDLGRQLRAMGRRRSTYGDKIMSDYYTKSAQEEVDRQYAPILDLIRTGSNAVNAVNNGGQVFGQNVSSTLAGLGRNLNQNAQAYGASQQQAGENFGRTMGSLGTLFNNRTNATPSGTTYTGIPIANQPEYTWNASAFK